MAGKKGGKTGRKGRQDERRLEESVRAAIARDPGMRGYEIGVKARGGEIVLTGVVDVLAEKERLREIAAAVPGVERVEADLTVSTDGAITDRGVEMEAAEELAARPGLDPAEVGVKVEGGVAHLVGRVDGPEEERAARAVVARARGVTEVQSHLKRGRKGNDPD